MRTITVCPGIGDFLWLAQKLVNTGEKFDIIMSEGLPQRGHQLAELLPQLINSHQYKGIIKYDTVNGNNIQNRKKRWSEIKDDSFYLSANKWLEDGKRIEGFLPDLNTTYQLQYTTSDDDKLNAEILLPEGKSYIGIYTSAYSNARNWNAWGVKEWFELIKLLNKPNVVFVIIGALYDLGITEELMPKMDKAKIKYVNTVGQGLNVVVELLKRLSYFCGFPSGLSILNETLGKDGLMFYSKQIQGIINTWSSPDRIRNHNIKECLFCSPSDVYKWLKDVYLIHDKI